MILWPWYGREISAPLLKALVPFKWVHLHMTRTRGNIKDFIITDSVLVGFLYWNYFATVITDPGHPPKNWVSLWGDLGITLV